MGKIRRERQTYHLQAAKKSDTVKPICKTGSKLHDDGKLEHLPMPIFPLGSLDASIFKNLKIDTKDLVQQLPEPATNVVAPIGLPSKPTQPLLKLHKKEKMKLRRTTFLNKIEAIMNAGKKAKATKKRQKIAVIGDVHPMTDALSEINTSKLPTKRPRATKVRPIKKFKARQIQMIEDIKTFKQVINHPSFQNDPKGTILDHLQNKLKEEM